MFSNVQAQTWKNRRPIHSAICTICCRRNELYNIPASITLAQGLLETVVHFSLDWHKKGKITLVLSVKKKLDGQNYETY
ncbi:MAG: hypothetical protein U0T85_05640 [Cloacibacterium normanense]